MKNTVNITDLTITALYTALLCIVAAFAIPVGPLPVTLTTMVIVIYVYISGGRISCRAVILYILMGACGLPVFSGMNGGLGVLLGPNGGYIAGYIFFAATGAGIMKLCRRNTVVTILGFMLGNVFLYCTGLAVYMLVAGKGLWVSFSMCVLPFIIPDVIKITAGVLLGKIIKKRTGLYGSHK